VRGKHPRLLLNKVVTKVLILGCYTPLIVYIYSYVIYNGIKSYSKHMTKT
jgi:hypothetical protein